ncbi:37716_t:CDS:2, partial [Gigaspora margarita]
MGITEHYTKLRLQVGMYKARIVNDSWSPIELPKLKKENTRALNLVFKELFDVKIANDQEGKLEKNQNANQFGSSVLLLEISNDKRKKETVLEIAKLETRIEKCSGCEHNKSIVEGNCTTRIRFDVGWKVIPKNTINPSENEQEFKNLRSLESPEKELILQAELKEELKKEILTILTKNSNCQKRKYCYYTDGSLQKDNKDKGNIAVMGAAVVQGYKTTKLE